MATGRIGTTPVLQVRWSKAPSAGTTSLSGLDDNSVSLVYSVGYEAVYRNGVLLSRTNDYTATNGTTITLIDATIAGDIIEVFANQTIPLADTYSQTVANGKFINNTLTTTTGDIIYASAANTPARLAIGSTSQVLTVSGGIPAWATPASGALTKITSASFSAQSSVTVDSVFSSTYKRYQIIICATGSVGDATLQLQMRYSGSTETGSNYFGPVLSCNRTGVTWVQSGFVSTSSMNIIGSSTTTTGLQTETCGITMYATNVGNASESPRLWWSGTTGADLVVIGSGRTTTARTYTGFLIKPDSGTISGSYQVYGLEN